MTSVVRELILSCVPNVPVSDPKKDATTPLCQLIRLLAQSQTACRELKGSATAKLCYTLPKLYSVVLYRLLVIIDYSRACNSGVHAD